MKHKEIKRWAAGRSLWDDKLIVAQATLVESKKKFRVVDNKGSGERFFVQFTGNSSQFHKEVDLDMKAIRATTPEQAVEGMVSRLRDSVVKAEITLRARKQVLDRVVEQVNAHSWEEIK